MHRRPVLGILQPGRRLKQAPEQFGNHLAVVRLQQFAVGQSVLAAPAAQKLPFSFNQLQAGLQALPGHFPGFGNQLHACLHGSLIPDLVRPAQRQGIDCLLSYLLKQLLRRGMLLNLFHTCVLLVIFWWASDHNNTRFCGIKLSPYVTKKMPQTKRYQQFLYRKKRRLIWRRPHMDCPSS